MTICGSLLDVFECEAAQTINCPTFNLGAEVTCRCEGPSRGGTGSPGASPGRSVASAPRPLGASDTCGPSSARTPAGHTTAGSPAGGRGGEMKT